MIWVLIALTILVLGTILWVVLRSRAEPPSTRTATASQQPPAARPTPARSTPTTWGKTVVVPDPAKACPAVLRIQGQTFESDAAPRLPLADCSFANCQCHYVAAKERRSNAERRSGTDRRTQLRFEPGDPGDRRSGKDRRHRKGYDWDRTI
jgi:hypothetical protein